ncbi:hydroxymethylglutaryl-CoA lyase [Halioglobus japonicus]|uniref:Hydroxymethylglutaryl-CoA lyase n=1 Tax=Halioglobus japonicus TaxID=930805 RepID=A0AAP8SPJ0_9GAMM|nr:hydroxymethylglutaryl-CoA lyase [Halioglobus japonicus]AQA19311.1 hydroxymethylglutaryl-CoA lyase [Halioglobus japonicus]PLW87646.1 hydroxymethylglutaryl-CoA lyase [Halioglobus japonicus]GHD07343.1 hydroxymethylglutaryl-CoA lyase [Halioglobus japonicus]
MIDRIVFTDVGPRDGLQNQPKILTIDERLALIESIAAAGVKNIEVGSFVSPKAVPAMAGTDELVRRLPTDDGVHYSALIPNRKGYELARDAGVRTVNMVLYASEGMAQRNVKMSIAEAEEATGQILEMAKNDGVSVVAAIATAFCCPFDGPTDPGVVKDIVRRFTDTGIEQLVLADTIGAANPMEVRSLTADLVAEHGADRLGCHFHDTRAMGLALVFAALESGIYRFDASIGGLGGCPFAPGASGNVASEDVVMMLEQMGVGTGIDLEALLRASDLSEQLTGTAPGGRAKPWLGPWLEKQRA